eukprot:4476761-Karenia_brevis.AAC.1
MYNTAATPAGWGVHIDSGARLFGPVITDTSSKYYLGASVGSNNTGELTAIGEAMLWLRDIDTSDLPAIVYVDSKYAMHSAIGQIAGDSNA